jgi:diguanylate cyclase (GGDEF)-like protein/PAS domain S-box-containing protein
VQGSVVSRFCFVGEVTADVVGLDADPPLNSRIWSLPSETFRSLLEPPTLDGAGFTQLGGDERAALRLPVDRGFVTVLELLLRGDSRTRGFLLLASEQPVAPGAPGSLGALCTQVSLALESHALTEELHRQSSEARFRSLVQNATDLITVLDSDGMVIYQSPSITGALGYTPEEVVGTRFDRLTEPGQNTRLLHLLANSANYSGRESEVVECVLSHRNGSTRQFEILHMNLLEDQAVAGIVLNGRDISERKAFEEQLTHQAFHDAVTALPNRALLKERVGHALARAQREKARIAVIFLDLDDFKTINDSLGHAAGDGVLLEVAKRLCTSIRVSDTASRFGGDEFAILLEDTAGPQEVADTAERILENLQKPLHVEGKDIVVRASLGISVVDAPFTMDADTLMRNADAAMYIAKRDGKGSYRLFEPAMHADVLARLELRTDLQRALTHDELELFYQPVVRLHDASISGVEALVRWRHPERGLLAPDQFIPFAEETELIILIGRWVLREGCRQAKALQDQVPTDPPMSMNINISVNQLHHSDIVADVRDALEESGLDPAHLTLEITETVMMTDSDLAERRLSELKALGVRIALDDFGTGYSSLSYLARFPVDILKMDRSFLSPGALPLTSGLAAAVIGLGKTFELAVVAEGIETPEQWATLAGLGCDLGQGFHFARPMTASSTVDYLRSHPTVPVGAGSEVAAS